MEQYIAIILELATAVLEKIPDYSQRRKNEFYSLKKDYTNELLKNYLDRDDNKITILRNKISDFAKVFTAELKGILPYEKN